MTVDVVFVAWNRLDFSRVSFELLLRNTNWGLVRRLVVYDDGSTDGTRGYLNDAVGRCPVPAEVAHLGLRSPVAVMLDYLASDPDDVFAKVDNDIAMSPGWLDRSVEVMEAHPDLELLGLAAGWTGYIAGPTGYEPSTHIGGVGLMRTSAFRRLPGLSASGRFGFTEWQQQQEPVRGWITPDVQAVQLDLLPHEPWKTLTDIYVGKGWARRWPPYENPALWEWMEPDATDILLGNVREETPE